MKQPTIFISLVAYCDNELVPTLIDIFAKARHPERVRVGLINQDDDPPRFHDVPGIKPWLNQIAHKHILPSLSKGYGACRAEVNNTFYRGEDFYFQIAPHSRLAQDWDEKLISIYKKVPGKKHILVATPYNYNPETEAKSFFYYVCGIKQFHTHAIVAYKTERDIDGLDFSASKTGLIPQPMFVAACIFAPAKWLKSVPYDENIFLMGEEFDISLRTFGAGFHALMFKDPIVYHCWGRRNRKKIGQVHDKENFTRQNNKGKKYIFDKLMHYGYHRQSEFMGLFGLTRQDLQKVYNDFQLQIGGKEMSDKLIRVRALMTQRYSTGFKTRAGEVCMVQAYYLAKFPAHFQVLEDKKPEVTAHSEVKNMKAEQSAPLSTESRTSEHINIEPPAPQEIAPEADLAPQKRRRGRPRKGAK